MLKRSSNEGWVNDISKASVFKLSINNIDGPRPGFSKFYPKIPIIIFIAIISRIFTLKLKLYIL